MATSTRVGRVPRSARRGYWRAQVEAHRRSGQSQVAFCAQQGLRKGTFSFWKWKLARDAGAAGRAGAGSARSAGTPAFIPIQLTTTRLPRAAEAAVGGDIEIVLGRDRSVRVRGHVDPAWLAQVLRGIEALGC
jgi:hypothetical protein